MENVLTESNKKFAFCVRYSQEVNSTYWWMDKLKTRLLIQKYPLKYASINTTPSITEHRETENIGCHEKSTMINQMSLSDVSRRKKKGGLDTVV